MERLDKIRNSVWGFFIQKRPIAILLTLGIIIMGSISAMSLPQELQPEINIPFGSVSTFLPGANPVDTEKLLTIPLEEEIGNVNNIKNLTSSSSFGASIIFVEFEAKADLDISIQELKDAVDRAKPELPDDATDPMVVKAESNDVPVISFSVSGDQSLVELTEIAEFVQDELEIIKGVSRVDLLGGQKRQIEVIINEDKLNHFNLSIQDISNMIKFADLNVPIGITQIDKINYSIRINNEFESINDIRNIPLMTIPGQTSPILLKDIASIKENFPEQNTISRFSTNGQKAKSAVSLSISKKDAGNIIEVADTCRERVEELLENGDIESSITIEASNDNSEFIRKDLGLLTRNGIQTTFLIMFVLFLALGLKEGFFTGLSIPLSFLIAFTVMNFTGMTINSLSLFSLVIALGLMVDTAIVIMEGIHEYIKKGYEPKDAALLSVDTYKWPLIAGTMTSIFAFSPMLLVSGILGEFLKVLPITISATLFASLFIALTIEPSLATKYLGKSHKSILGPLFNGLGKIFHRFIKKLIKHRITRVSTILIALTLFVLSLSLPVTGVLKTEMFPQTDIQYFFINVETPKGIILEETEEITKEVENYLQTVPEIDNFLTVIGQSSANMDIITTSGSLDSNLANITVNLINDDERELKSYQIAEKIRDEFKTFTGAKVTISELSEGPPSEAPITVRITGDDIETLKDLTKQIESVIKQNPYTENVSTSISKGLNEFVFIFDREALSLHGLSAAMVAGNIRNIVQGLNSTELTINGEDLDILVKYDHKGKLSISEIENFKIATPGGYFVTLAELGSYEFSESVSSISHEDQTKIMKVVSDIRQNANIVEVTEDLQKKVINLDIPKGYELNFGGDLEDIQQSFNELYMSMFVGILLIAFTLVLMFNSFRQPFVIILTLPLALIGVFPGLLIIGLNLSFPAFLGVVALAGIVVNDAIVLIDRINQNRKKGLELTEAISESAHARLQPIFMTSITTIIGILPLAISNEFWAGLGFSLIFGLAASTLLTLIVIPVLYYLFEARKDRRSRAQ